jgi:hypothetical protein
MDKIIDFLKSQSENNNISGNSIDKEKLSESFNDIKSIVNSSNVEEKNIFRLKTKPKPKKGQIWLCKQKYYDAFGNEIIGNIPYLVVTINDVEQLANEDFIRIQPICSFTEFAAVDEILVNDKTIVGFDFIIETWNEQPILTELLAEYVGTINIDCFTINNAELSLSKVQQEFRKSEIRNTSYLRQSINSMIEFEEQKEGKIVLFNIDNSVHYPKSKNIEAQTINFINEQEYSLAAKKGKFNVRPTYLFEKTIEGVEIKIKIIKDNDSYILSLKYPGSVELKDIMGDILKQTTINLYDNLKCGLYFIRISGIEKEIRIRLK